MRTIMSAIIDSFAYGVIVLLASLTALVVTVLSFLHEPVRRDISREIADEGKRNIRRLVRVK